MIDLVCIASGPSLKKSDCDIIKDIDVDVLTVNNSWKMAPWCEFLYAGDLKWWNVYNGVIPETIEKWTSSQGASKRYDLNYHAATGGFNSGMRALLWAIEMGFREIVLLGYDCSLKNGIHWHGPHEESKLLKNPTPKKTDKWKGQFLKVHDKARTSGVRIFNCSRYTELDMFPKFKLEDLL